MCSYSSPTYEEKLSKAKKARKKNIDELKNKEAMNKQRI